ncbi:tyrosine-protein kinase domain-containing protein [Microlunatus ginsengisoli]|uniref:non-specific protein-tyrosine kinase n=1 Tax=Microlunatus ginsengisoli TaxID=363863 RepID=A0ABP6ZEV2_9ACTN
MALRDYIDILRRRWLAGLAVALTVLAATAGITLLMPEKYTATTRLFFAVQGTESVTDLAQGSTFAEKQITSYAQVATSPLVLDPVIDGLHLDLSPADLAKSVSAVVPTDTVILEVSVVDEDPAQATAIANAIGTELARVVSQLSPEQQGGGQAVKATILQPAVVPVAPSSPDIARNLALGLVLALLLGVFAAFLRNVLDTKIRSDADLRSVTDAPLLGSIAFDESVPTHPVVVAEEPLSAPSEAVRRLRTNLQFVGAPGQSKKVVITSSVPGEGKTTTSINLAVSLADAGAKVILVDADLRRPAVAEYMGLEGAAGLTTVLIGKVELADVIQPWRSSGLDILPSGQVPPNPSELLGSPAMAVLLDQLGESYDVVLLDSAPLLPVTDAAILTKLAGGALVVVGADRIHRRQLEDALEALATAGAEVHGLALNKVAKRDTQPYAYHGGYYRASASDRATDSAGDSRPSEAADQSDATYAASEESSAVTVGRGGR